MNKCTVCGKETIRKNLCSTHHSANYRKLNPSYQKDYKAEWRTRNPEGRKLEKERTKKWAAENRHIVRKLCAEWRTKNKEYVLEFSRKYNAKNKEKQKKWRTENKERVRDYDRKKKLRRYKAEGWHTAKEVAKLWWRQKGCCAICKTSIWKKYHEDHITPLIKGGGDHIHNIQLLCPQCNQTKHAKDPIKFMQSLGFLL